MQCRVCWGPSVLSICTKCNDEAKEKARAMPKEREMIFTDKVRNKSKERQERYVKQRGLSDRLAAAMCLTPENIRDAEREHISWDVGEFTIAARHFCHLDGWYVLLFARPRELNDPGWNNVPFECNSNDWDYYACGTATAFLPLEHTEAKLMEAINTAHSALEGE